MNEECFTHFLKFYDNRQQKIYFTTSRITESQTIHCINILSVTSILWIPVEQITINRKATKKKFTFKKYPLLYLKRYVLIMRDMYKLKPILKLYKDKWRERIGEWISNILFKCIGAWSKFELKIFKILIFHFWFLSCIFNSKPKFECPSDSVINLRAWYSAYKSFNVNKA